MTRGKRKNAELLVEYLQQMLFPWREILAGLRGNGTQGLGTRRSVSLVRGCLVLTTQATGPSGTRGHEHKAHTAKWEGCSLFGMCFQDAEAAAHQAPLSMGFPKPDYWSGLPLPSPGDLLHPGIEPRSPALQVDSLPTELQGKLLSNSTCLMPCTSSYFSSVICLMYKGFPVAWMVKNLPAVQETQVQPLSQEEPLEKGMAIHTSILAWRIPWTEEPGRLQAMGAQRVGHN